MTITPPGSFPGEARRQAGSLNIEIHNPPPSHLTPPFRLELWTTQWKGAPKQLTLMQKPLGSPMQRFVECLTPPSPPPPPPLPGMNELEVSLDEVGTLGREGEGRVGGGRGASSSPLACPLSPTSLPTLPALPRHGAVHSAMTWRCGDVAPW